MVSRPAQSQAKRVSQELPFRIVTTGLEVPFNNNLESKAACIALEESKPPWSGWSLDQWIAASWAIHYSGHSPKIEEFPNGDGQPSMPFVAYVLPLARPTRVRNVGCRYRQGEHATDQHPIG
jgi:hypothetical protein